MKAGASATLFGVRLPWELAQEVSRAPAAAPFGWRGSPAPFALVQQVEAHFSTEQMHQQGFGGLLGPRKLQDLHF